MKTSFYFVVWIVIYPLLGLIGSQWIDDNAFFVALICVWALSWFLNRSMPQTLAFERALTNARILDQVYSGNIEGFRKRLARMSMVEFFSAVYFGVAFIVAILFLFQDGSSGIFELIVFGLLAGGTLVRASKLQKQALRLRNNPVPQESIAIAEEMGMDYSSYYDDRQHLGDGAIMPPAPKGFAAFQVFSLIVSIICTILGVVFIVISLITIIGGGTFDSTSYGIMALLYGSLAAYYGAKDCISSIQYFRLKPR